MRKNSHFNYVQTFILVILIIFALPHCGKQQQNPAEGKVLDRSKPADEIELSKEVKEVLDKKKDLLLTFAGSVGLVPLVGKQNEANKKMMMDEILARDKRWQGTDAIDDVIKSFMTNDCAQAIFNFQQQHDEFTEIFITDSRGALIGITNRTSDYYQADEGWWQKTYNQGKGLVFFGEIEYDESSRTEAIGLFVPIVDPHSGEVLGVMKAVLSIAAIKTEL